MTETQKQQILIAWDYCEEQDKSTEFMLQYISDVSGVCYDEVVSYVTSEQGEKDIRKFWNQSK